MLILRFSAVFVLVLADFILNHCLIMPGVPGACVKHFMLPDTNVMRFWRAGAGDKGVDLKTCISAIKLVKKTKSAGINVCHIHAATLGNPCFLGNLLRKNLLP